MRRAVTLAGVLALGLGLVLPADLAAQTKDDTVVYAILSDMPNWDPPNSVLRPPSDWSWPSPPTGCWRTRTGTRSSSSSTSRRIQFLRTAAWSDDPLLTFCMRVQHDELLRVVATNSRRQRLEAAQAIRLTRP
jgi:hypothetical protein